MNIITKLKAIYTNEYHPAYDEDGWEMEWIIENEDDLYDMMVEIHRTDARLHVDFPLNGSCNPKQFEFKLQKTVVIDGEVFRSDPVPTDHPDYLESAYLRYRVLKYRMMTSLPSMRRAQKRRIQKEKELELLSILQQKYKS